ncbi:MAG: RES family NAD+ phosphorylase [Nitrosomonas sp.]|nr:RES family NAD+ phosphorylase [Nitrosomonas sp.]MBP6076439.1 RES family NAD+ phosphorylase [Nitrosomonas sp.]
MDYIPTQFLAELIKHEGFDGICYKSGSGKGLNYLLFNLHDADLINCSVMRTISVEYKFEECSNPYFVKDDGSITFIKVQF